MSNSKIEFEDRLKKGLPFEKKLIDRGEIELEYFKMSANPNKKDKIHGDIFVRNRNEIIIAAILGLVLLVALFVVLFFHS